MTLKTHFTSVGDVGQLTYAGPSWWVSCELFVHNPIDFTQHPKKEGLLLSPLYRQEN